MGWSEIHESRSWGPVSLPLALLSFFYGMGVKWSAKFRRKRHRLPGFVLSIGNITAGGTGKTPATMMIARWAVDRGYRAAVLSRGYGGRYDQEVLEVSDGREIRAKVSEAGDEPVLMAENLPGVPVVVSKKRYLAGLHAQRRFQSDFFLLDDGFQHTALERDLDLVLLDADSPFGNGRLLPWGPLREPVENLSRATAFLITRWEGKPVERDWEAFLGRRFPGKPLFRCAHAAGQVVFQEERHGPDFLQGKRIFAFAGIARPAAFRKTLLDAGADLVGFRGFRDHHRFTETEIRTLVSAKDSSRADLLITTEKDWVRLERLKALCPGLAYLSITMKVISGEEPFFDLLNSSSQERIPVQ
ncbi:MAG: tetraacyldisaccharide 4'-kinase [Desulfobacteraceae bacterium]|nr:MAG: tetraacyldisaccharide 4'-kinase [Desulfobacteraceae bacterium]